MMIWASKGKKSLDHIHPIAIQTYHTPKKTHSDTDFFAANMLNREEAK
jgi:hypothetical protein